MKQKKIVMTLLLMALTQSAMAGKPTGITFKETKSNSEGVEYQVYSVKCSDGQSHEITAWNNRNLWCIGDTVSEDGCHKKQVAVAKKVCK